MYERGIMQLIFYSAVYDPSKMLLKILLKLGFYQNKITRKSPVVGPRAHVEPN